MNHKVVYNAPWGALLKSMTALSICILVGIPMIGVFSGPHNNRVWILSMIVMPLTILITAAFFSIRGYVLTRETLFIQRIGWSSKVDLTNMVSVEQDPKAMSGSLRTCGNGGMFCFAGAFRNKKLGAYRAFATDPKRSVVLKLSNRTIVVTPDSPEEFVAQLRELRNV